MEGATDVPAIKDSEAPVYKSVYLCMSGWEREIQKDVERDKESFFFFF